MKKKEEKEHINSSFSHSSPYQSVIFLQIIKTFSIVYRFALPKRNSWFFSGGKK